MNRLSYTVTREDITWIAGKRVQDGKVELTSEEAEHDLARGHIVLDKPEKPSRPAVKADEA
jgi:hypothetical protein